MPYVQNTYNHTQNAYKILSALYHFVRIYHLCLNRTIHAVSTWSYLLPICIIATYSQIAKKVKEEGGEEEEEEEKGGEGRS